jgi:hypothetical protein
VCWYCGCELDWIGFHVEHKVPRVRRGLGRPGNLVPSCGDCNMAKGTKTIAEFREHVTAELVESLGSFGRSLGRWENQYPEALALNDAAVTFVRRLAATPVLFSGEQAANDYSI